ncbi:MAG: tyrosine-type recombinase/integrase [Desulfosarcina sp.]|nr:tyrosine-type recombinase/integrase [Desulfobacterales bacterium]
MNPVNRPGKGARIKVEPIRSLVDIKRIQALLEKRPRDLALFTIGTNTPLRVSDLLALKFHHVCDISPGGFLVIREQRTGRRLKIGLNRTCGRSIAGLVRSLDGASTDPAWAGRYLFQSRRGEVLLASSVHRLVKSWCKQVNLIGNYGANSLRKTWGYHQFATFGTDLNRLMTYFNHATRRQTLDYLCLQPQDFKSIFEHEL